jgi:hypothetical protein
MNKKKQTEVSSPGEKRDAIIKDIDRAIRRLKMAVIIVGLFTIWLLVIYYFFLKILDIWVYIMIIGANIWLIYRWYNMMLKFNTIKVEAMVVEVKQPEKR